MKTKISIDLHLHFDGSLSIENVKQLAKIENVSLPSDEILREMLTVDPDCKDLGQYLTKFSFPLSLLQTKATIEQGMKTLCDELVSEGCIYAEIRFAPQLHLEKGLTQSEVVRSAIKGFASSSLKGGLILCCMRGDNNEELNFETVEVAQVYLGKGVLALDLAGNEAAYATEDFGKLFDFAKDNNIPFTIHAGEADSAKSVLCAIEMGASRIGHGVRSYESEETMDLLQKSGIPLELCPTSNLQTAIFKSLDEYPIKKFIEMGICVTVNSDNRSVSGTTSKKELALVCEYFGFGVNEEKAMLENSARAAFSDASVKQKLLDRIEECYR